MNDQLWIDTLSSIDAEFYETYGKSFDGTRKEPWQGWARILDRFVPAHDQAAGPSLFRVVDLGCGNARFFHSLCDRRPEKLLYVGIDRSQTLLDLASKRQDRPAPHPEAPIFETRSCDVLDHEALSAVLAGPRFDLAVAFGLMHHIPTSRRRLAVLEAACRSLAERGHCAVSFWRFDRDERIRSRAQSLCDELALAEVRRWHPKLVELARSHAESGDCLMPWGPSGDPRAIRFCHSFSDEEIDAAAQRLTERLPVELAGDFAADGRSGDMNRYLVFRKR